MSDAQRVRDGDPVAATWVSIGHPAVAELAVEGGFDLVFVDTEHAATDLETVENVVRAVDAAGGAAVVRAPWNDPVRIKRVLDTGPAGVMVPMLEDQEDAEAFVEATRYPPDGIRGLAASRASGYGTRLGEYYESGHRDLLTVGQIETERGVENAADIAEVDGLDALLVGPADLSASLGIFGEYESAEFEAAFEKVVTAGKEADTAVGTLATAPERIPEWVDRGVDFLIVGYDIGYLMDGGKRALEAYQDATSG